MMYFFLWTKNVAVSGAVAIASERKARISPPLRALFQRINLTAIARNINHALSNHRRPLNRTAEPGAPDHFTRRCLERHGSQGLHIDDSFTEHQRRRDHFARPSLPFQLT